MRLEYDVLLARLNNLDARMKERKPKLDTAEITGYLQQCRNLLDHTNSPEIETIRKNKITSEATLAKNEKPLFPKQTIVDTCTLLVDCHTYAIQRQEGLEKIRKGEIALENARREKAEKEREEKARLKEEQRVQEEANAEREKADRERLEAIAKEREEKEKKEDEARAKEAALSAARARVEEEKNLAAAKKERGNQEALTLAAEKAAMLAKIITGIATLKSDYMKRHNGSERKANIQFNLDGVDQTSIEAMKTGLITIINRLREAKPNGASSKTLPAAERLAGDVGITLLPKPAAVSASSSFRFLPSRKPQTAVTSTTNTPAPVLRL